MTKTYDIAEIYQGRLNKPADTARAILLLARNCPKALEMKNGILYAYKVHKKETGALNKDEILEVIDAMRDGDRIKKNSSTIIGDLVEVSRAVLCAEDMEEIYKKLIAVRGVSEEESRSCRIIKEQIKESKKRDLPFPNKDVCVKELQPLSVEHGRAQSPK